MTALSVSNRKVQFWRTEKEWWCAFETFEGNHFYLWGKGRTMKSALRALRKKVCARGVGEWMDKHTQQDRRDMLTAMIEEMTQR